MSAGKDDFGIGVVTSPLNKAGNIPLSNLVHILRANGLITPSQTYGKEELSVAENRTAAPQAVWTKEERITFSIDNSFENEVRAFIECIDSNCAITSGNSEDALKVMRLVERIYASG